MNRRNVIRIAAGVVAGSGAGIFALSKGFKPAFNYDSNPPKLTYQPSDTNWKYSALDPVITARKAYDFYPEGSCMYGTVKSIVTQLAQIHGEPYISFPAHMFRYGHGGIGGYGSVCGALNGAAAVIGLVITDKDVGDKMILDLFQWYENESLPRFIPNEPGLDFTPPKSVSGSVLCHASNTKWCKESGYSVNSDERKERCRRLTGDVAQRTTIALNDLSRNQYVTFSHGGEVAATCNGCHGSKGKINNTAVQMSCTSCHTESVPHKVFSGIHYKLME